MDEIKIPIPGRLKNVAKNGHVAGTEDIYDDALQKTQKEINAEQEGSIAAEVERATGIEELLQSEVNALSNQNYVSVDSYSELPDLGSVDTVYRVGSWDGTQVDPTKYAEYAWNNTGIDQGEYKLLSVKTQVGEVFDISDYRSGATYADLAAALDGGSNVPEGVRKGGMSIKFVQTSDNKYVQYRLMADDWSVTVSDWQGVDDEPTAGSNNLVKSGGVNQAITTSVAPITGIVYNGGSGSYSGKSIVIGTDILTVGETYVFKVDKLYTVGALAFYNSNNESLGRLLFDASTEQEYTIPSGFDHTGSIWGLNVTSLIISSNDKIEVVKTTQQNLNNTQKNQAKVNLGILDPVEDVSMTGIGAVKGSGIYKEIYSEGSKIDGIVFEGPVNGNNVIVLTSDLVSVGDIVFFDAHALYPNGGYKIVSTEGESLGTFSFAYNSTYILTIPEGFSYITTIWGPTVSKLSIYIKSKIKVLLLENQDLTAEQKGIVKSNLGIDEIDSKIVSIATSDKIGIFSTSYMNGYCMKNHHHLNHMSMFLDYIFYNYGISGFDEVEMLNRLENDQTFLGAIPPSQWNITYGIIMHMANSGGYSSFDKDTIYQNSKKLANAVKSLGGKPIFSTEFNNNYNYYQPVIRLCDEDGYMFMNWGTKAEHLTAYYFSPFWYNAHPSTRTGWLIANGMLPYLKSLPRPKQSVKLFRVREGVDTSVLQNLVYEDFYSRAERYVELTCGVSALSSATEKYFDRLDDTSKLEFENIQDEYQKIQNKDAVNFGNYALAEFVLPYDKTGVTGAILNITSSGINNAYILKRREMSNPLPINTNVSFGITSGTSVISVGDKFTVTGGVHNNNMLGEYTVGVVINGLIVTTTSTQGKTTSGTDVPVITSSDFDVSQVSLSGSYSSPSIEYINRYKKPLGEWVAITLSEGSADLSAFLSTCMDYDKVSILFSGNDISISDIYVVVSGTKEKQTTPSSMTTYVHGNSALTDITMGDNTSWENISQIPTFDNESIISTVTPPKYERLPVGITTVKEFTEGMSTKQSIIKSVIVSRPNRYEPVKMQCRIVARYFPDYIDSDSKWATSEITEQSFDIARLKVSIGKDQNDTNPSSIAEINIGAFWDEYIFDTFLNYDQVDYLKIECTNKKVQIASVEFERIDN